MRRNVQERAVLERTFDLEVDRLPRRFPVVGQVLVELGVFLGLDVGWRARPKRSHRVQRLADDDRLLVLLRVLLVGRWLGRFLALDIHLDRPRHEIGIAAHDVADPPFLSEVGNGFRTRIGRARRRQLQRERDRRAVILLVDLLDRVVPVAATLPSHALLLTCTPRVERDLVRDHEARVEADTELTNELGEFRTGTLARLRRLRRLLQSLGELLRSGASDRADVLHDLVLGHPDPVVVDHEFVILGIAVDSNVESVVPFVQRGIRESFEAELVERVGRIRDQLSQEDLLVAVERMDHQVEELLRLGLEFVLLCGRGHGLGPCCSGLPGTVREPEILAFDAGGVKWRAHADRGCSSAIVRRIVLATEALV